MTKEEREVVQALVTAGDEVARFARAGAISGEQWKAAFEAFILRLIQADELVKRSEAQEEP